MNLRYNYLTAYDSGEKRHAQAVMRELGITYQHGTPQTVGDQWWFWNCKNVPDVLPSYLSELDLSPMECIGFGLSEEEAISLGGKEWK